MTIPSIDSKAIISIENVDAFLEHFVRGSFNSHCPADGPLSPTKPGQTTSYAIGDNEGLVKFVVLEKLRFADSGDDMAPDNQLGLTRIKDAGCIFRLKHGIEFYQILIDFLLGACLHDYFSIGD